MSTRKKWGKTTQKTDRLVRDSVPKAETLEELHQYVTKARSVTEYDLANKFNVRMSVARSILREKEAAGTLVPYVREGGFVVYTSPTEMAKRQGGRSVVLADALEEVASSAPESPVITEEMEAALAAASVEALKPSKVLRQRREVGERKERERERRPEVIIEPLPTKGPGEPARAVESVALPRAPASQPAAVTPTVDAKEARAPEAESKQPRKPAKKPQTEEVKPAAKPVKKTAPKSTKKSSAEEGKPAKTTPKKAAASEGKPVRKTAKKAEDAEKKPKKQAKKE